VKQEGDMSKEYDNDERLSWRDIDKKRERSSHVSRDRQEKTKPGADRWDTGRYKKALEKLFLGDKGTIEHGKLYNKIHKSYGSPAFLRAVQGYIEKYGLPDDTSTLLLLFDTKNQEIIVGAIDKLQKVFGNVSPREKEDIQRKLSIVALTDKSNDIREKAADVAEELKARL
jgi:hypothetical protein